MSNQITDTTIVFFGMSLVTVFLAMVIIAISVAYYKLSRSAHSEREAFLKRQEQAKLTENQIIADARRKSQDILLSAQAQAQQMLQASDIFSNEYKQEFKTKLLEVLSIERQEFKKMYQQVIAENTAAIQNESKNMLAEYKKTAYQRIGQDISELVATISKKVLRKSMSQDEHTQLVLQALKEAKENKVI